MKTTARTLLSLLGLASLATIPLTACQDLAGDCHNTRSCPEYAQTGGMGGEVGDGDGDGDAGGAPGDGDGDGDGDGETGGRSGDGTGGGDGAGGTGGNGTGGMVEPCDGGCEDPTPFCDDDGVTCVECRDEDDCDSTDGTPACDIENGNVCVECAGETDCADTGEVCDVENGNVCVGCLDNEDCEDGALCDTDTNTCEECLADSDCEDSTMARCDIPGDPGTNACMGCTNSEQCAGHTGTTVCDILEGECVECTVVEDDRTIDTDACGTGVCLPETQTCDDSLTQAGTETCESCVADNQCAPDHDCVPMDFKGADRGGYCLQNVTAGCAQPFTIDILDRETLSGMGAQTYCGIREEFTTCEAVLAFGEKCPSDTCPEGGICRKVGSLADKRCTYECDHDLQCNDPPNPGSNCGPGVDPDPVTPDYCGGQ